MSQPAGGRSWWVAKSRRAFAHLGPRVSQAEMAGAARLASPEQLQLFWSMHPTDQRHGLAVYRALRAQGASDPDLLLAALLHDAGKGPTGLLPRVVHSLGQAYGAWIPRLARRLPGMAPGLDRLADHPSRSAEMAAAAGCSPRAVELIRWQEAPRDAELGPLLRLADEAN
jgi:hypothetical protein